MEHAAHGGAPAAPGQSLRRRPLVAVIGDGDLSGCGGAAKDAAAEQVGLWIAQQEARGHPEPRACGALPDKHLTTRRGRPRPEPCLHSRGAGAASPRAQPRPPRRRPGTPKR